MRKSSPRVRKTRKQVYLSKVPSMALIVIDQDPIRKDYIKKCKKAYKDLQKAQKEWHTFEAEDMPAYEKWYNHTFGAKLSEIRETHTKAGDLYHLINEVHFYADHFKIKLHKAYEYVMDKKKNPEKYTEREWEKFQESGYHHHHTDEDDFDDFDEDEKFTDEEIEELFKSVLRGNPELARKCKDKKFREAIFADFKASFQEAQREQTREEREEDDTFAGASPRTKEEKLEDRIKYRYRKLVRILHPDFREKADDPELDEIWHKVQEAYKNKDIERLDMLLAICNIKEGKFSDDFSISQILDVSMEYKAQLSALRKRIRMAKKDKAWGFSNLKNTKQLETNIKRDLNYNLEREKSNLVELQEILNTISRPMREFVFVESSRSSRRSRSANTKKKSRQHVWSM